MAAADGKNKDDAAKSEVRRKADCFLQNSKVWVALSVPQRVWASFS